MARVLGLSRQSSSDDKADTLDTQRILIQEACEDRGDELVFIVEDMRSGKHSTFSKIRNSSEWFSDKAKLELFDTVMVSSRDRIDRDVRSRLDFLDWLEKNDKAAITTSGTVIRAGTADEWMAEASSAVAAEHYRRVISEKRSTRARILKRQGKIGHGSWNVTFGYCRGADGFPKIVPEEAEVLRRICSMILDGQTLTSICLELTDDKVYGRRGSKWSPTVISRMIRRLSEPYSRSADGMPYYYPEIVSADDLARVRDMLAKRSFRTKPKESSDRHDSTLLLQIAFCRQGHPLYSFRTKGGTDRQYDYRYYRCRECKVMVEMGRLDSLAAEFIDAGLGGIEYRELVYVPGSTHLAELEDLTRRIEDIESQLADPASTTAVSALTRVLGRLEPRRAALEALPVTEARTELRKTGKTIAEEIEAGSKTRKRKILAELGVKLTVWHEDGKLRVLGESPAMVTVTPLSDLGRSCSLIFLTGGVVSVAAGGCRWW